MGRPGYGFPHWRLVPKPTKAARPRLPDGPTPPTVKPVGLMAWLVRLVTPPGGHVLDPFAGTGTTAAGAIEEARAVTLIERDPTYFELIRARLAGGVQTGLF